MNAGLLLVLCLMSLGLITLIAALRFGGPGPAPEMASISDPFKHIDWRNIPSSSRYKARDGTELAYRHYASAGNHIRVVWCLFMAPRPIARACTSWQTPSRKRDTTHTPSISAAMEHQAKEA